MRNGRVVPHPGAARRRMNGGMTAHPESLCVLIVDDCPDTTATLAMLLRAWGHRAHVANEACAALKSAAAYRPDVVILDVGMPHMNGWDLAQRLRAVPGLDGVYLVVVSGYSSEDDRRHSKEAGCDLHLAKPVEPEELRRLLEARVKEGKKRVP